MTKAEKTVSGRAAPVARERAPTGANSHPAATRIATRTQNSLVDTPQKEGCTDASDHGPNREEKQITSDRTYMCSMEIYVSKGPAKMREREKLRAQTHRSRKLVQGSKRA